MIDMVYNSAFFATWRSIESPMDIFNGTYINLLNFSYGLEFQIKDIIREYVQFYCVTYG